MKLPDITILVGSSVLVGVLVPPLVSIGILTGRCTLCLDVAAGDSVVPTTLPVAPVVSLSFVIDGNVKLPDIAILVGFSVIGVWVPPSVSIGMLTGKCMLALDVAGEGSKLPMVSSELSGVAPLTIGETWYVLSTGPGDIGSWVSASEGEAVTTASVGK